MPTSNRLILAYSLGNTPIKAMDLSSEFEQAKLIDRIKRLKDVDALESVAISLVESNFRIRDLYRSAALAGLLKP